jgi:hypothetical protein
MVGKDIPRHRRDFGCLVLSGRVSLGFAVLFLVLSFFFLARYQITSFFCFLYVMEK